MQGKKHVKQQLPQSSQQSNRPVVHLFDILQGHRPALNNAARRHFLPDVYDAKVPQTPLVILYENLRNEQETSARSGHRRLQNGHRTVCAQLPSVMYQCTKILCRECQRLKLKDRMCMAHTDGGRLRDSCSLKVITFF